MEDSWVTLAPSAPSGHLCAGKGQIKSSVRLKSDSETPRYNSVVKQRAEPVVRTRLSRCWLDTHGQAA